MSKKKDKKLPAWTVPVTFAIAFVSAIVTFLHTRLHSK